MGRWLAMEPGRGRASTDAGSNSPRRLRNAAIEQSRPAALALTGCSPIQSSAPEPFFSNRIPWAARAACSSRQLRACRMIGAASSIAIRSALRWPVRSSRSRARPDGLPFALIPRPEPLGATIRAHGVETARFAFPPLSLLDAGDRPVGDLEVEAVVDGDDLLRRGVDAVDGDVDVAVVGVAVKRIDGLVLAEAHLGEEHPDRLVRLGARRLLTLSPAQDPVLHRLRAATGDLGEVDHLLYLTVVVDVEEVDGAAMLDLLAVAAGRDAGDVVDQGAHVRRPCSWALRSSTCPPS